MTALVRYDAACRALAEAKAVDEVKEGKLPSSRTWFGVSD